jgi:predicted NUDIX family phosphoesterase
VLVDKRGKLSGEKRLVAQQSVGLGGHIRHEDVTLFAAHGFQSYRAAVRRELEEEVTIAPGLVRSDRIVGVINDDSIDVGKVHFGIVHVWELERPEVERREAKINSPHFVPLERLGGSDEIESFETWSQLCIRHWSELSAQAGWSPGSEDSAVHEGEKERRRVGE